MSEVEQVEEVVEEIEQPTEEVVTEAVSLSEIQEAAKKQGWKEDGELGPLEFLSRGSVFRDNLHKEINELKAENSRVYELVAEHIHSQKKKDFEGTQRSLEDQIRDATEAGDVEKVLALTKKLNDNKPPEKDPATHPKAKFMETWVSENKWFESNEEMRDDAQGFYQAEMLKLGYDDPEEILPKVRKKIEKVYPKEFKAPENPNRQRSSAESKGKAARGKGGVLSVSDLDDDEKAHFDQFIKMGMDEEKLLASIQKMRG